MSSKVITVYALILLFSGSKVLEAGNDISSTNIVYNSTYEHISIHASITGDDNLNSSLSIEYKLPGNNSWSVAANSMRTHPNQLVDGFGVNLNFHAGSVLFLIPDTQYNVRLTLIDPDGGGTVINDVVSTKAKPTIPDNGQIIFVIPGNGGGSGTSGNPYLGVQSAVNNAQPGHIIQLADGVYSPFDIQTNGSSSSPIVITSENHLGAIIDGGNTSTGIVQVGNYSDSISHIIIDGLMIRNGKWGIDAQNTQHLTVQHCNIYNVDYGFINRREFGWERDQYIYNNRLIGRTVWPQSTIPRERGIDIRGNRNVVSHNTIRDFADGVSTDGKAYKTSYALDIHHNDISRIVDDLIEVDGMISNARIYRNKCYNGRAGVSVAPVFGGPAYIFRNELVNIENSGIKMNRGPSGLIVVNNTIVKSGNGLSSTAGWQNTILKNNAVFSTRYCFEEVGLVLGSRDDWDYNGYWSARPGTVSGPWFKWNNLRYNNLFDLQINGPIEANSKVISPSSVVTLTVPTTYTIAVSSNQFNLMPVTGSTMIDAGTYFPNLNDLYVLDGSPDLGALEAGMPLPEYGHDFTPRVEVSIKLWLQGAYNNSKTKMSTELQLKGLLPMRQPYQQGPWNYPGQEGLGWSENDYPAKTVDWVLVSFRTNVSPGTTVAKTAGILLDDGSVYFPDERALASSLGTSYYVVVEHRNHMAAMSDGLVNVINNQLRYDFRVANSYSGGGAGQTELSPSIWALHAGDGNQVSDVTGYDINGNDILQWKQSNGAFNVYSLDDFSMEGDVNGFDRTLWDMNNGVFSAVKR